MAIRQLVYLALVVAPLGLSSVSAFSAQLSRPWEPPLTTSTSVTRRRRRLEDSAMQSTSVPTQDKDSDDATGDSSAKNDDDEETMMLQEKNHDSFSEVIIAQPHPHTFPVSSSSVSTKPVQQATVASSLRLLFGMTRPSNFPGVVLLHILGAYLALQSPSAGNAKLIPTLLRPRMMVVLVSLLLTSAASMVVRAQLGKLVDSNGSQSHQVFSFDRSTTILITRLASMQRNFINHWWVGP